MSHSGIFIYVQSPNAYYLKCLYFSNEDFKNFRSQNLPILGVHTAMHTNSDFENICSISFREFWTFVFCFLWEIISLTCASSHTTPIKNIKYIISYSQEWIMLRVWSEKILRIFSYKIWLTWNAEIFIIWENNPVNHYCGRCLCVHSFNISGTLVHVMCEVLARQGKTLCMCYDELIVIEP